MADDFIGLDESATIDKKLDTESLTVGANTVHRERVQIAGAAATAIAGVDSANGLDVDVTRVSGNVTVVQTTAASLNCTEASAAAIKTATELIDDIVHSTNAALSKAAAIAGQLDDTTTTAATEDNVAPVRITAQRGLHVNLRNNAGTEVGTSGAPVRVDPTGTTAQPVTDNGTTLSVDDGAGSLTIDNAALSVTGGGIEASALRVTIANDSTGVLSVDDNGGSLTIDGTVTANAGTGTFGVQIAAETTNRVEVQGDVAHDVAAAGNPVLVGLRANQNEPAAVADADSTYAWGDQQGRTVVVKNFPASVSAAGTHGPNTATLTAVTDAALVAAPGAGQSIYVTGISASNTSATKSRLDVKDGTTIRYSMMLAADGGGFVDHFDPPWKITANTALNGALGTAVTDVRVNVHFFIAP